MANNGPANSQNTLSILMPTSVTTVAQLPTTNIPVGTRAFVTDVLVAIVYGGTFNGGGSLCFPCFWDGTTWRAG
jgi:hypothetical protein